MATLLVNRNCMESLRKDITELQGTVIDVFSRTGAVRYPSWKFPDKVSCDLDLVALLGYYDYVENDPEFTHHSHAILLELVIDRLLLLLQSFTGYTENLISEEAVPPSRAAGPCMSVGLAVRKYWNSMLKLGGLYQQLVVEQKTNKDDLSSLKCPLQVAKAENEHLKSWLSARSESDVTLPSFQSSPLTLSASSGLLNGTITISPQARSTAHGAAKHFRSIHSQTVESSLVPCDACEKAQASLREVGSAVISICNNQNLPSSLSRFLGMVEETLGQKPLAAMDLSYWASEQSKDLSRINKHLQALMELVNPLKEELQASEKQRDALKNQLAIFESGLQTEKEAQEQQRKEAELQFEKKITASLQLVTTLENDKEELQKRTALLEKDISTLKGDLEFQQATIQVLERTKSDLQQEMQAKMVDKSEVAKVEDQMEVLSSHLESAKQQLNWATSELEKEKSKVESMVRHKESLQAKQKALMQQLDNLDQEREQLRNKLADREDDKSMLKEQLKDIQEEKQDLQQRLEAQQGLAERAQQEKLSLEQSVSELQRSLSELTELIHELKERERLLVSFPDLHMPVEAQYESTGDVIEDMGKQLQANNIRINILEEENMRLRAAVVKMKEATQQGAPKLVPPTQLWIRSSPKMGCEDTKGLLQITSFQGAVSIAPGNPTSFGNMTRNASRTSHSASRDCAASRLTSGTQVAKASSAEAVQKAGLPVPFPCDGSAIGSYPSMKEKGRPLLHPALCTRNHRK